ncbi:unnamed protein product, partial [Amoebophrya sp. A25]
SQAVGILDDFQSGCVTQLLKHQHTERHYDTHSFRFSKLNKTLEDYDKKRDDEKQQRGEVAEDEDQQAQGEKGEENNLHGLQKQEEGALHIREAEDAPGPASSSA